MLPVQSDLSSLRDHDVRHLEKRRYVLTPVFTCFLCKLNESIWKRKCIIYQLHLLPESEPRKGK